MSKKFRRAFLRAPIKSMILYVDGDYVFKAKTLNISEGGVLLENLPKVPDVNAMPVLIPLVQIPTLSEYSEDDILNIDPDAFSREFIRSKAKMVRKFEGMSEVDSIFVTRIGCEFVLPSEESIEKVKAYVDVFAKNTVYLLGLFESGSSNLSLIRQVAQILGYDHKEKLPELRQKVLHDYQSLESL